MYSGDNGQKDSAGNFKGGDDMKISLVQSESQLEPMKRRVAAYARVSMDSDRLRNSLFAQVSTYSNRIQANPDNFSSLYFVLATLPLKYALKR